MTVLQHPVEPERTCPSHVPEAIISEARQRGRRRRAFSVMAVLAAAGAAFTVGFVALHGAKGITHDSRSVVRLAETRAGRASGAVVAWGDYSGAIHLGDVVTGRQIQIASFPATKYSAGPVAFDRGRLLLADSKGRIRSLVIDNGNATVIARGTAVAVSPDGSRLYVDQGTTDFLELGSSAPRATRRLVIPAGWNANPWVAPPIAGGLLLTHSGRNDVLGVWHFGTTVRPLGASVSVLSVYTPINGRFSLVAWTPKCRSNAGFASGCPIAITNTDTGRTLTVRSPSRWGFTSGAFSPDGSQLATFMNTDNPGDSFSTPNSELAIVDTKTGLLRLDRKVKLMTTEDAAWATWLRSGDQLLTGAITATDLVNASDLATRPFYFDGDATRVQSVMSSPDLNFSTIAVPASALSLKQRRALGLTPATKANAA